jgi:hypothetical protein
LISCTGGNDGLERTALGFEYQEAYCHNRQRNNHDIGHDFAVKAAHVHTVHLHQATHVQEQQLDVT